MVDRPEQVHHMLDLWDSVRGEALPHQQSIELIAEVAETWISPTRGGARARSNSTGGACGEVADNLSGIVGVRDSKDPTGPP